MQEIIKILQLQSVLHVFLRLACADIKQDIFMTCILWFHLRTCCLKNNERALLGPPCVCCGAQGRACRQSHSGLPQ